MQMRALIMLFVALVMGGIAVVLVNTMLQRETIQDVDVKAVKTTPVVVAAVDLKSGTRLDKLSIKLVDWPQDIVPEGSFNNVEELLTGEPPIVLAEMRQNEPIMAYKLSPHGARAGLPRKIPEDMRAVTIPVTEVRGVAGFVLPGTYVDILHTTDLGRKDGQLVTRTLLQNIEVLAVDQISTEDQDKPVVVNAVTLLVYPKDGKRLTLAQELGNLSLMLRNEFDASIVQPEVITVSDLLTQETAKPVITQRIRRVNPVVEIIRGLDIEKQRVKEGELPPGSGATSQ